MERVILTGGAMTKSGWASWPMATLTISHDQLHLNSLDDYRWSPKDILEISVDYPRTPRIGNKPLYGRLVLDKGITIRFHTDTGPDEVAFWSRSSPFKVLDEIIQSGFLSENPSAMSPELRAQTELRKNETRSALRRSTCYSLALIVSDVSGFTRNTLGALHRTTGFEIAAALVLAVAVLSLFSNAFRTLVLKPGRDIEEIRRLLYALVLITGFMLITMLVPASR
jgi:hypothetical protein